MLPRGRVVKIERVAGAGSSWALCALDARGDRWVVKLRGAAQGTPPLVAEVIVAELAEALGLRVPSRGVLTIDAGVTSDDRHEELIDLIGRSVGDNLGFRFLPAARRPSDAELAAIEPREAATVRWLDGLVDNRDRTAANPNLLVAADALWLIDHGAALPFHYRWPTLREDAPRRPFSPTVPHVFAAHAETVAALDGALAARLSRAVLDAAVAQVPDGLLLDPPFGDADRARAAYAAYLWKRLVAPRPFVDGA